MSAPDLKQVQYELAQERKLLNGYLRRLHNAEARVKNLESALDLVMWMAKEYAEAGGSNGPEMRAYREAEELLAKSGEEPKP